MDYRITRCLSKASASRQVCVRLITPSALAVTLLAACQLTASSITRRYAITDLPPLPDIASSHACAVNNRGMIVGYCEGDDGISAVMWRDGKTVKVDPTAQESKAFGVNPEGEIVGEYLPPDQSHFMPCKWEGGKRIPLGAPGIDNGFAAASGSPTLIVGSKEAPHVGSAMAVRFRGGKAWPVGPPGCWASGAVAASGDKIIAGWSISSDGGPRRAWVQTGSLVVEIPGHSSNRTWATAVNKEGYVAGCWQPEDGSLSTVGDYQLESVKGCLWHGKNEDDLGDLGGCTVEPTAINDKNQVVGSATLLNGIGHAFLWEQGHILDLNKLLQHNSGWVLKEATGINNRGQICGVGTVHGKTRGFLLTPLP